MHELYYDLTELCETAADEIRESNDKIKKAGGKISPSDLDYLDKLTHMLKSIKTTKAMMEAEEGYSGDSYMGTRRMDGMNASYARGRGRNTRRDSMGRYASTGRSSYGGYSYDGDMIAELRELMEEAPNMQTRQKFQQFISEIEKMA